jgi:glycosyltransferase involved in cell wall biosynthesis
MKIAVLIPCYNEALTIKKVIDDFKNELPAASIYVYDNNSTDGTYDIAKSSGAIVRKEYRQGKGNVVKQMLLDIDADYYLMVDGDDTYPAIACHQLLDAIISGEYDMSIGDRLSNGSYLKENKRALHNFGNSLVKNSVNYIYSKKINDVMTGYRCFSKLFAKTFPMQSEGFQMETELTMHALNHNWRIKSIDIDYQDRPEGSVSKLNTVTDGFKVILTILQLFKNYKPLSFFMIFFAFFFISGLMVGIPVLREFIQTSYISKVPSAILSVGLILSSFLSLMMGILLDARTQDVKKQYNLIRLQMQELINKQHNRNNE